MSLTKPPVKRGWSSAPRGLLPRFHRPALAEGSAPGAPPAGAPPPRPPRACLSTQRQYMYRIEGGGSVCRPATY
eukprot:scaffold12566_cov57-Phaeocystis_antarctica.AAC.3